MNYQEMIDEISKDSISAKNNVIIIGSNASGKTDVLKKNYDICTDAGCYLIDSVNKKFIVSQMMRGDELNEFNCEEVTKQRFELDTFNIKDTFLNGRIENILSKEKIKSDYQKILSEYFNEEVKISFSKPSQDVAMATGDRISEITIGETRISEEKLNETRLSDGQQSIFRLLLELVYFKNETEKKCKNKREIRHVFIDEIDTFLDKENSQQIMNFIDKKFPNMHFIVTTHSADVLFGTNKANIIAIPKSSSTVTNENNYFSYSAEDIDSISLAESILQRVNDKKNTNIHNSESSSKKLLTVLYNKAILDTFSQEDLEEFNKITYDTLSNSNKYLYKCVQELLK